MGLIIQNVRPNYFNKELLKYIFMKSTGFHKYIMNNLKD